MKNYGQHNAIMAGINISDGDYVILMDDDFQHSPKEINKLITKLKKVMMFVTLIIRIINIIHLKF
jgi:glycosyltransferase involved in cell wall biosynthesis